MANTALARVPSWATLLVTGCLLGALVLGPRSAAGSMGRQDPVNDWIERSRRAWTLLPRFDGSLAPGEVELAPRSLAFAGRWPGRHDCGATSDWPYEVETRLLDHVFALDPTCAALPGRPWPVGLTAHRAILPGDLHVYAVEHRVGDQGWLNRALSIVLFDPETRALSREPLMLERRWSPSASQGLEAWSLDVTGDGAAELGFVLTHHNGTVEHGSQRAWFRVGPALELTEVRRTILVEEARVGSHGEEGIIRSRLVRTPDGGVREDAWYENPAFGTGPRRLEDSQVASIVSPHPFSSMEEVLDVGAALRGR